MKSRGPFVMTEREGGAQTEDEVWKLTTCEHGLAIEYLVIRDRYL